MHWVRNVMLCWTQCDFMVKRIFERLRFLKLIARSKFTVTVVRDSFDEVRFSLVGIFVFF